MNFIDRPTPPLVHRTIRKWLRLALTFHNGRALMALIPMFLLLGIDGERKSRWKKKKQKSRLRIKGEGFDSRLGWMMGGVVGMELAWKKGIGLAAKTQGNSRLNRVLTKLPVHKSIPFRGTSSLPGGGEGDGISAPFSSRRFQFAVRLGTRTPEGPLFLIGDFQKLHPQPSSLRGQ